MTARRIDAVLLTWCAKVDGVNILTGRCSSTDEYFAMPEAVEYEGKHFGKTGWNSDVSQVYYKDNVGLAYTLDTKLGRFLAGR